MSFRQYGGINYAARNNIVKNNYTNANNLSVMTKVGQPSSIINVESGLYGIAGDITFQQNNGIPKYGIMFSDGSFQNAAVTSTDSYWADFSPQTSPSTIYYTGRVIVGANPYSTVVDIESDVRLAINGGTAMHGNLYVANGDANDAGVIYVTDNTDIANSVATLRIVADRTSGANYIQSGETNVGGTSADLYFTDMNISNIWMTIKNNGKVGIGTISPGKILEVNGDALINGLTVGRGSGNVLSNTVVGSNALNSNTSGTSNVAIGFQSLLNNTTGIGNTALGYQALYLDVSGNYNTAVGTTAMYNYTASGTAYANTAIGHAAMYSNVSGLYCTAVGYRASYYQMGGYNTSLGFKALLGSSTVTSNGTSNCAIGDSALEYNTSGSNNVAVGHWSLLNNTTGNGNTVVGSGAGKNNTSTSNNTYIGYQADCSGNISNSTAIGYNSKITASNQIMMGTSSETVNIPGGLQYSSAEITVSTINLTLSTIKQFYFVNDNSFPIYIYLPNSMASPTNDGITITFRRLYSTNSIIITPGTSNSIYDYNGTRSTTSSLNISMSTNEYTCTLTFFANAWWVTGFVN